MEMTKKLMTLVLVMLALTACKDDGEVVYMLPEKKPIQLSAEQKQMRDNNNEFAWRLFQTMQEQKGEVSTVLSPISVTYMLGMLNAGAAGTTRDEITATLGFGSDPTAVNEFCKKMIEGAPNVDPAATVKIANCINVNSAKGLSLLKQYVNDMKNYYSAQVEDLDFTKSSTLEKINKWCSKNTDGMIPSILDELNPNAAMCLLNAIYSCTARPSHKAARASCAPCCAYPLAAAAIACMSCYLPRGRPRATSSAR